MKTDALLFAENISVNIQKYITIYHISYRSVYCLEVEELFHLHLWVILLEITSFTLYRVSKEERSLFWEVMVSVILSKKVYMYMDPILNNFWDRAISLYSSKIVDKKDILRTVSNTGIYCSRYKVGIVYLV
jgi:hypothetical protein